MLRLKKEYKGHDIKLRLVQFEDKGGHKETIAINGYQIDLAWMPYIDNISDEGALAVLFEDCLLSIERYISDTDKRKQK